MFFLDSWFITWFMLLNLSLLWMLQFGWCWFLSSRLPKLTAFGTDFGLTLKTNDNITVYDLKRCRITQAVRWKGNRWDLHVKPVTHCLVLLGRVWTNESTRTHISRIKDWHDKQSCTYVTQTTMCLCLHACMHASDLKTCKCNKNQ